MTPKNEVGNLKDYTVHQSEVEREQVLGELSTIEELVAFLNMSPQERSEKKIRAAFWVQLSVGIYYLTSQLEPPYWTVLIQSTT